MSLYQCEECGCQENTACGHYWCASRVDSYNWEGIENRKGKKLCSVCGPTLYSDGSQTKFGVWHRRFKRIMLPIGQFKTNSQGNLEHIETGSTNIAKHALNKEKQNA
jgi:hypothetical protein